MLTQERKEKVIALCRELLKTRSYSGEEEKAAGILQSFYRQNGFDEGYRDAYGNVTGTARGEGKGPVILFDGHIDTVPAGNLSLWNHDPFGAEVSDGRIFGRGASDMKGAVAAYTCAAAFFLEDRGRDFAGTLCVDGVVHEECFEGVASRRISERIKPDLVVIGEASELSLKCGQRGRAEIVVESFGKSAHSANPQKGFNAVYPLCEVIGEIRNLPKPQDDRLGYGILELVDIKSEPYPGASVVPDYCRAVFDRRLLCGETKESVLSPVRELCDAYMKTHPGTKLSVSYARGEERCYTGEMISGERFFPAWYFDRSMPYLVKAGEALRRAGLRNDFMRYDFCTNGSHYAGEAGILSLGYGPSAESQAHVIDEFIVIDELLKACEGYYALMEAFLCGRDR